MGSKDENNEKSIATSLEDCDLEVEDMIMVKPSEKGDVFLSLGGPSTDDADHNGSQATVCAICLNDYQDGDQISWSHNKQCPHYFHRHCIAEWLMSHDDCPCCRVNFLRNEESSERGSTSTTVAVGNEEDIPDEDAINRGVELFLRFASLHALLAAAVTDPNALAPTRTTENSASNADIESNTGNTDAQRNTQDDEGSQEASGFAEATSSPTP